jgi:hypothetical protein
MPRYAYRWRGDSPLAVGERVLLPENWLSRFKDGPGPQQGVVTRLGATYRGELAFIVRRVELRARSTTSPTTTSTATAARHIGTRPALGPARRGRHRTRAGARRAAGTPTSAALLESSVGTGAPTAWTPSRPRVRHTGRPPGQPTTLSASATRRMGTRVTWRGRGWHVLSVPCRHARAVFPAGVGCLVDAVLGWVCRRLGLTGLAASARGILPQGRSPESPPPSTLPALSSNPLQKLPHHRHLGVGLHLHAKVADSLHSTG